MGQDKSKDEPAFNVPNTKKTEVIEALLSEMDPSHMSIILHVIGAHDDDKLPAWAKDLWSRLKKFAHKSGNKENADFIEEMMQLKKMHKAIPDFNAKSKQATNYKKYFLKLYKTRIASPPQDPKHINIEDPGDTFDLPIQLLKNDPSYIPDPGVFKKAENRIISNMGGIFFDFKAKKRKIPYEPWDKVKNPQVYNPSYKEWKIKYFTAYKEWKKDHLKKKQLAQLEYYDEIAGNDMDYSNALFTDYDFHHYLSENHGYGIYKPVYRDAISDQYYYENNYHNNNPNSVMIFGMISAVFIGICCLSFITSIIIGFISARFCYGTRKNKLNENEPVYENEEKI